MKMEEGLRMEFFLNRVFNNEAPILYKEPLQSKNEYSVMDSSLFSKNFAWRPQYNLEEAIIDIKNIAIIARGVTK